MSKREEQTSEEKVYFTVPLHRLEPVFKNWIRETQEEIIHQMKQPIERYLSLEEACEYLSLTKPTIYKKVSNQEIPVLKKANRLYFKAEDLINYLESGRQLTKDQIKFKIDKRSGRIKSSNQL